MLDSVFEVIFLIGLIAACVIRALHMRQPQQSAIIDHHETRLEWPLMILSFMGMQVIPVTYVLTSWLDVADYHLPTWAGWVGTAAFAVALWLLWKSHADLGRNWSPMLQIRENHSLVSHGVFHYIRHPMYAAHGLWAIAQPLLLHNWIAGLAFLLSFLPLYLLRVPREEQMMLEYFGEEYRSYMDRTGRVIPRLWRKCPPPPKSGPARPRS